MSVVKGQRDLPENRAEMIRAGYKLLTSTKCKTCQQPIEWWLTTKKKKMPFDSPLECENPLLVEARVHVRHPANEEEHHSMASEQIERLGPMGVEGELAWMAKRHNARCVVLIQDDDTCFFTIRNGEPAEYTRSKLISAGNAARAFLQKKEAEAQRS